MIDSVNNKKIKEYAKLKQKKYRKQSNKFLVEGYNIVEEALKANCLLEVMTTETYDFDNVTIVSEDVIRKLSTTETPQPIIGVCIQKDPNFIPDKILALDGINDPGNLGTLIRSAVAFGFNRILLSSDTVDIFNPKVIRATQGAIFKISYEIGDLIELIRNYPNYKVITTSLNVRHSYTKSDKQILVLGNESNGVSDELLAIADSNYLVHTDSVESLNVAVAGSIIMNNIRV